MLKFDFLKSKLKFSSKLKDRQRLKGCSFSNSKNEESINSSTLDEYRKKRMKKKLLREKEMNVIKNNWEEIRRRLMVCEKNKDKDDEKHDNDNDNIDSFSKNLDHFMKRFYKKDLIKQAEYLVNKKKDKTIEREEKSYINEFDDIINQIKNKSYNFYKIINDSNIKEQIKENNNFKTFKFYKDFLSFFKNLKRSSSAQNIKSKILSKINNYNSNNNYTYIYNKQKNSYLYYSSLIPKQIHNKKNYFYQMIRANKENSININNISDKKQETYSDNQNSFLNRQNNITKKIILNRTENTKNISPKKKSFLDDSIKSSLNKTVVNPFKSKINLKRAYVVNKPSDLNKCKYFMKSIQNIKIKPKENQINGKEDSLITFSNLDNDSKTNEDTTIFRLKKRYTNLQMPNYRPKVSFQRKLFLNKLKADLLK